MSETDDVVERIRGTLRTPEQQQSHHGFKSGQKWARVTATGQELQRLESFRDRAGAGWETHFTYDTRTDDYVAKQFFYDMWPNKNGDIEEANRFWSGNGLKDTSSKKTGLFVQAFAKGALSVWDDVKSKL
jgi:hypothetical protein